MATKKVAGKSAKGVTRPKQKTALPRVLLTTKIMLNTRKKDKKTTNEDVRSFIALVAPSGFEFDPDPGKNKVKQRPGVGNRWGLKAFGVSNDKKRLFVMAKCKSSRVNSKSVIIDDTLDLDVTVTNQWDGEATIDHIPVDAPPIGDFPEDP